eukprot:536790_1
MSPSPLVSAGFIIVGTSSWITINGLYNELSLMVDHIPESWAIGTYVSFIIQLANISVLFYSCIPTHYKTSKFIVYTTYLILFISFLCMLIMAATWNSTVTILGKPHSIYLYLATFGTAMSDCMTSMVFWVFVSWFPTQYIPILSAGESASGIVASFLIWAQQAGTHNPRFSVEIYLILLASILPLSALAFYLLLRYKSRIIHAHANTLRMSDHDSHNAQAGDDKTAVLLSVNSTSTSTTEPIQSVSCFNKYLLCLGILSGIQNGMIPSIGTYALLPYGNTVYITANTISNCVNPITASLPSYFNEWFVNDTMINATAITCFIGSGYVLIVALCSPNPWGSSSDSSCLASVIIVICYVLYSGSTSCCKSCCITFIKQQVLKTQAKSKVSMNKRMETVGKVIQLGSFTVALLFFVLVQYADIFNE